MAEDSLTLSETLPVQSPSRAVRSCRLRQVNGDGMASAALGSRELIIGRAEDAGLRLNLPAVSRHHASITCRDGEYVIRDLSSTHGVHLNGVKVASATLRDGDIVQVASVLLSFEEG